MMIDRYAILCLSVCLLPVPAARAADLKPPKPDPANPVNYVEWINRTMGAGLKNNAAPVYRDAYAEFVPYDGDLSEVLAGPWSDKPKVSQWLARNRGVMEEFRKAAAMQECFLSLEDRESTGDPRRDHLLSLLMIPHLEAHRPLCRALIAEGYQAWKTGDRGVLISNAVTVIRSGQHLDNTIITLQRLNGTSCIALAYDAMLKALSLSENPDNLAGQVLVQLQQVNPARVPFSQVLLSERLMAWDMCQRLLVPGRQSGTWSLYGPMVGNGLSAEQKSLLGEEGVQWFEDLKKLPSIGFDATLREVNASFDEIEQLIGKPYDKTAGESDRLMRRIKQSPNPIVRTYCATDLTRAHRVDDSAIASLRATYLVAHILAYHGKTGSYPASLDELNSPDLRQVRTDPFSGRDFVYKRQATAFTLYTVSENLKDEGGQHSETRRSGDFVFWPVQPKAATRPARPKASDSSSRGQSAAPPPDGCAADTLQALTHPRKQL
jgi:hypothetical protein